jgi:nucleotide-binding universal stress UspA family protein
VTFGDVPLPVIAVDDILHITTERANSAVAQLRVQYPGIEISSEVAYGDFEDLLEEEVSRRHSILAIIGNDEEPDSNIWIGSDASSLLREAPIPILAVPQSAAYKIPVHLCLACDTGSINNGHPIDILHVLKSAYDLRLTVLHLLSNDETPVDFEASTLGRMLSGIGTTYVEMSASDSIDGIITDYAVTHGMDWLAVIPHHYGFWEGLFHKSHTEKMLQLAHIPVLALH